MPAPSLDLLKGTLDLLILKSLSWGPAHGYAVARWIERLTADTLQIGEVIEIDIYKNASIFWPTQ